MEFIKTPARNSYALVGCDKVLSFQFKYVSYSIKPFVLAGTTHLEHDHSINYTYHHSVNLESCVEDFNITLFTVSHIYNNTYNVYVSTTGDFNETDPEYSFYLCKLSSHVCTYIYIIYVIVITQARALCLIYTHDARGRAVPEGECIYIRQSTSACVITNMLHFQHSKICPNFMAVSVSLYSNGYLL